MCRWRVLTVLTFAGLCGPLALIRPVAAQPARPATRPVRKVNITVSRETTYITGPLNADGTVNYVAYLNAKYSKGVTPQNNAMVLLARAIGPKAWSRGFSTDFGERAFKAMGVAPPPHEGDYFITLDTYKTTVPQKPATPAEKAAAKRFRELIANPSASRIISPARISTGTFKSRTMRRITRNCCASFLPNTAKLGCTILKSFSTTVQTPRK